MTGIKKPLLFQFSTMLNCAWSFAVHSTFTQPVWSLCYLTWDRGKGMWKDSIHFVLILLLLSTMWMLCDKEIIVIKRLLSWLHGMKSRSSTTDFNIDSVKALDIGCTQAYTKDIARIKPNVWIQLQQRTTIISDDWNLTCFVNPLVGDFLESCDALFKYFNPLWSYVLNHEV